LLKFAFPAALECLHPAAVFLGVGYIDDEPNQVVAIENGALSPMAFDFLSFVAGGAELLDDFEEGVSEPLGGDVAAVVELEREQHLESPPLAAHKSPFPLH
jgi:hypothetical protein